MEDNDFPKAFDGSPRKKVIDAMRLLHNKLKLVYSRKLKQQPAEHFRRKTAEAFSVPEYSLVDGVMDEIRSTLTGFLQQLEDYFRPEGCVQVRSNKDSTTARKHVSST